VRIKRWDYRHHAFTKMVGSAPGKKGAIILFLIFYSVLSSISIGMIEVV